MLRAGVITLLLLAPPLLAADPEGVEHFEKRIRPLLAEHCSSCHGPQRQRSGLTLTTAAGIRQGGDRGAPIVAGRPGESLLIRAISYSDDDLRMPPKGKLSPQQIEDLTTWVKRGAPLPDEASTSPQPSSDFNLAERRKHWSYQPIRPARVPIVAKPAWCSSPIDYFILSRLEAAGLSPAGPAESHTLIRRLTFDLTGLPPTPDEVRSFEQSAIRNPQSAIENLVDRLLASPRYGERWGRHWLDLVRYSETLGFEFDYDLHNAWRYRDYIIRAFNDDLPYDQFVIEHLAGDLVPQPRRNPLDGTNESILATGFFWMGEGKQTPVDIRQEQADRIDNQIEVLGKALLGQTISCARCHDHKFDAISTRDYYALAGYLKSSRYQQAFLDPPERSEPQRRQLAEMKERIRQQAISELVPQWRTALQQADRSAERWVKALGAIPEVPPPGGPLPEWSVTGDAFGEGATIGDFVVGESAQRPIAAIAGNGVHSGLFSLRLQGELRSPTFTIEKPFIHCRLGGHHARLNLVIDGNTLIMNPMYGKLTITPEEISTWRTMPLDRWIGHRAYIELSDSTIPMHRLNPPPSIARMPEDGKHGYLALEAVVFSDDPQPPKGQTADVSEARLLAAVDNWSAAKSQRADVALLDWLLEHGLLDGEACTGLQELLTEYQQVEATIPTPSRAPALADGTGEDEFVFLRGNYKTLGECARRGPPAVIHAESMPETKGSGRLELARRLVDPSNPLLARVMVNRLWQHHFGEGLVRTPDDFGRMGQAPTHPELLDFLAAEFIRSGWSIKHMHRLMLLSSTWQMSSSPPQSAIRNPQSEDSENRLLSHRSVRRLEAEAIRDAVLAVSGRLNSTQHGPSVLPYLTPHMEGRGRPQTGPLDGEGRRSIYINARRNFLTPMFVAFDYPAVFTTIGRRGSTSVPAQALTLMNDPFIIEQARHWAERTLAETSSSSEQRIESLYRAAFARSPTEPELAEALAFVERQTNRYAAGPDDPRPWSDLCHVLINVKEFIFVE